MNIDATLMVCDDVRMEVNGKLILIGVYTGDIAIPADGSISPHLMFLFVAEGQLTRQPAEVTFELMLPGDEPRRTSIKLPAFVVPEGRTKWTVRQVLGLQNIVLHPGHATAKVICDGEETAISAPWIVVAPPASLEEGSSLPSGSPPPS
jgi:hypothetical protein